MDIYQLALRTLFFPPVSADPEWVQRQAIAVLSQLDQRNSLLPVGLIRPWLSQSYSLADPRLQQSLWGLSFPNPIGLGAGFDKNGLAAGIWTRLGFGFAELGTVTWQAQPGNPRPRLFRLESDRAALNRMGFNNEGAAVLAKTLAAKYPFTAPTGINLGKSKITPLEEAAADYSQSFQVLYPWGDYFVVNVSSPNTPGLRSLQSTEQLTPILASLQALNKPRKPLLVKIAPDLEWEDIAAVIQLAQDYELAGIIATNTTISRAGLQTKILPRTGNPIEAEAGGISGLPLRQRSTEVIRFIYQQTQGKLPIIGVGGVFTAEDAWEKITAGASLVQVYTGWIYEGPLMVRRILKGLLEKLESQGLQQISEAVGIAHK